MIAQSIASEGFKRHAIIVRQGAAQVVGALEWLLSEGFEVTSINVDVERRCPVIAIKTIGKCGWLKAEYHGAPYIIAPGRCGRSITYRAHLMGCRVQWIEGGH